MANHARISSVENILYEAPPPRGRPLELPDGRKVCGGRRHGTPYICMQTRVRTKGFAVGRCSKHGPQQQGGMRHGMSSRYAREIKAGDLANRVQELAASPDLFDLTDDAALNKGRIEETLAEIATSNQQSAERWQQARMLYKKVADKSDAAAFEVLGELLETSVDEIGLWQQVESLQEQRRKLVDTQLKILHSRNQFLSVAQLLVILSLIQTGVERALNQYVTNEDQRIAAVAAIETELGSLVSGNLGDSLSDVD